MRRVAENKRRGERERRKKKLTGFPAPAVAKEEYERGERKEEE